MLIEEYGGILPDDMDTLLLFPGVGRKIANLLLGDIFHRGGVVTDTHCIRICGRLGFYPEDEKNPYKIEKLLTPLWPAEEASDFCHRIVYFGRDICTARSPRCDECEIGKGGLCEHLLQMQKKAKKDTQKSAKKESNVQKTTPKTPDAPSDKKPSQPKTGEKSTKIKIDIPIIVEGKYDKITLSSIADANIIQTDGFAVFNKKEKLSLIRRLGERHGVILLTDSDGGGRQIRSYLLSALPKEKVINLYIPQVVGKEKRKKSASRAGFLGVEGTDAEVLRRLLTPYAVGSERKASSDPVTKNDFYFDGFSGADGSAERRRRLALALSLPEDMSANALLQAVNLLIDREEYKRIISEL
jgi:ribonuclease M5